MTKEIGTQCSHYIYNYSYQILWCHGLRNKNILVFLFNEITHLTWYGYGLARYRSKACKINNFYKYLGQITFCLIVIIRIQFPFENCNVKQTIEESLKSDTIILPSHLLLNHQYDLIRQCKCIYDLFHSSRLLINMF